MILNQIRNALLTHCGFFYNAYYLFLRHRSLQYFTFSQSRSHFFRQVNGSLQTGQIFVGKFFFDIGLITSGSLRVY